MSNLLSNTINKRVSSQGSQPPFHFKSAVSYPDNNTMFHPLDPLSPAELSKASQLLRAYHAPIPVRFKVIDLLEAPKSSLVAYLRDRTTSVQAPSRKAYTYYHMRGSRILRKAKINLTTGKVEEDTEHPDIQGPADIDEIEQVYKICHEHPAVKAEIEKLKLPPG